MDGNRLEVTRIFIIEGASAPDKMQRIIDFASTLGGVAVSEIGEPKYLETGPQSAARHLYTLMNESGPYRDKWMARVENSRIYHGFSQIAVARVIADWLPGSGHEFEGVPPTARQLKDRIARTFKGEVLSFKLLSWFMGAFEFSAEDSESLMAIYTRGEPTRERAGEVAPD